MKRWAHLIFAIGLLALIAPLLLQITGAAAAEVKPASSLGVASYRIAQYAEKPPQSSRRIKASATATGVVEYRKPVLICPVGSERVGKKCARVCPKTMYRLEGKCTCPEGLVRNGNRCEEEKVAVVCKLPEIKQGERCILPPCPANMVREGKKCQCPSGTAWDTGESSCNTITTGIQCPEGSTLVGNKCELPCPAGMYSVAGQCACPEGLVRNGNRCEQKPIAVTCPPPSTLQNGNCVMPCPAGMTMQNGQCACPTGAVLRGSSCEIPPQITLSPAETPGGSTNSPYSGAQFVGNGGTGPYRFSISSGALPPGLNLIASGQLTGIPSQAGSFAFTVLATDAKQFSGARNYSITIAGQTAPPPPATQQPCPYGTVRFGANCVPSPTPQTPCPYGTVRSGANCVPGPTTQRPVYPTNVLYPREVQTNLKNLGCLSGRVDGIWGGGSRSALRRFSNLGNSGLPRNSSEPTQSAYNATSSRSAPACARAPTRTYPSGPNCSRIKYAYKYGNTCRCEGTRTFNGKYCVKKPSYGGGKPRCSKIKYAYTSGNTCKCSGNRTFNGKYCVKKQTYPIECPQEYDLVNGKCVLYKKKSKPKNQPNLGDIIQGIAKGYQCEKKRQKCVKNEGYWYPDDCSCAYP